MFLQNATLIFLEMFLCMNGFECLFLWFFFDVVFRFSEWYFDD